MTGWKAVSAATKVHKYKPNTMAYWKSQAEYWEELSANRYHQIDLQSREIVHLNARVDTLQKDNEYFRRMVSPLVQTIQHQAESYARSR